MPLWATLIAVLFTAVLFGWAVPLVRLFDAFQPLTVSLSIMLAAVLVRLNRGMPTLDWKSLDGASRNKLTTKIVEITKDYIIISFIYIIFIIVLVTLSTIGRTDISLDFSEIIKISTSSTIGGLISLSLSRMIYIIWRDFDIVRLQKKLIDEAGIKEDYEKDLKASEGKIADIRSASLKRIGASEIRPWDS